ncbi:hypothetical protein B0T22DRAFT_537055 [Podospora appendiculata]|uniref:Cyanovirin-N domain-containing protein n=1 Tax=Podospora appendiculata TaxID=314037 RepID=A0AAE0XCZ9_9PEZI|nr:hypothetical protein B0T22DRAFT_537055 [Podospora appendiculata]
MMLSTSTLVLYGVSLLGSLASAAPTDLELVARDANATATLERRCSGKINGYTQNTDCTGDYFEWTNLCDAGCVTNIDGNGNPTQLHSLYKYSSVNGWHIRIWSGPYCTGSIIDNYFAGVGCRGESTFGSFSFV